MFKIAPEKVDEIKSKLSEAFKDGKGVLLPNLRTSPEPWAVTFAPGWLRKLDQTKPLMAVIYDGHTGMRHVVEQSAYSIDEDDETGDSLNQYFYHEHWCGCHRADSCGIALEKGDCPDDRFTVEKIWHPDYPAVTLFYEE